MTKLIQFIGHQCTGKTSLAAGLFYEMKKDGQQVELIQEPARRRVYAKLPLEGAGQLTLIATLYEHVVDVLRAGVDWVVIDTHILAPLLYTKNAVVRDLCIGLYWDLIHQSESSSLTVVPTGERPTFSSEGRAYKEDEALGGYNLQEVLFSDRYPLRMVETPYNIPPRDLYQGLVDEIEWLTGWPLN